MPRTTRHGPHLVAVALSLLAGACGAGPQPAPRSDVELSLPPGTGEPNFARGASGAVVLTWHERLSDRRHALRLAVRDRGRWSAPRTIVESDSFFVNWADFPSLVELPNGRWIVHWLGRVPGGVYAYHVNLAVSADRGATWNRLAKPHRDRTPQEHGFVAMVPWNDTTAALVWLDGREMQLTSASDEGVGDMTVRFTTVTSRGRLGAELLLDERACECCQTALARTGTGLLAAYRDRSPEEIRDIAIVRYANGTWTAPVRVARDNWHYPGCPVNGPALSASGDTVAIAWFTAPEGAGRVFAAFSSDGGVAWGPPIRMDDGHPLGRADVELLGDGSAVVSWLEIAAAGKAQVRARRVRRDGRVERSWSLAETTEARSSGFPRMIRMGAELLFAWTTGEGIRVAAMKID